MNKMTEKYLPPNLDNKIYSPIGVLKKFRSTVQDENGNVDAVFKKSKYKQIVEMWYAAPLAVLINKQTGNEFYLYPSDNPDIHFVRKINEHNQEGFSVEVMTLYDYDKLVFDGDYSKLAKIVWNKKGVIDYDRTELLLVSRLTGQINIDKLYREINKYKWKFLRIWLSIYSEKKGWTLFEIMSCDGCPALGKFDIELTELPY